MKLFVGLGNPGDDCAGHRHNVGFMALDRIADRVDGVSWRNKFQGCAADLCLAGAKCLLLEPMTFMNDSGRSVGEAVRFYKIAPENIVVFHDEIDLVPGKIRVKTGGGVAGHNGLKSVSAHIGLGFRRVRIGVGHPGHKDKVHGHVLRDFSKADLKWLEPLLDKIADAAPLLAEGRDAAFMNAVAQPLAGTNAGRKQQKKATKPAQKSLDPTNLRQRRDDGQTPNSGGPLSGFLWRLFGSRGV